MSDAYSDILIRKFKEPRFKGKPEVTHRTEEAINPTCGDHIHLHLTDDMKLSWSGKGCMLCKASAEIICELHAELQQPGLVLHLLKAEEPTNENLQALTLTKASFPTRRKCVELPGRALEKLV